MPGRQVRLAIGRALGFMIHSSLYQATLHFQKSILHGCSAFWSHARSTPGFFRECWSQDRNRFSHTVPVLLGLGIAFYFYLPEEPAIGAAVGPLFLLMLARPALRAIGLHLPPEALRMAVWVSAGFAVSAIRTLSLASPQVVETREDVEIVGRIVDIDSTSRGGQRLLLDAMLEGAYTSLRLRVSTSRVWPDLTPGQWISTRADIKPLPAPVMPGGFDFGRKLWFERVRGIAFTVHEIASIEAPVDTRPLASLSTWLQRTRDAITGRILSHTSERAGPVAAAFLTGERSGIGAEDNAAMQASSLSHLLSISGLHMMLAGFGVFAALRYGACLIPALATRADVKKWAAAGALVASVAYLLLSGASIPTQRAFVTVAMAFVAILADRNAISMRTVAIAATIVLLTTPEAWMDPSFQMSFCAVVMLVAAYEWWNNVRLRYWREDGWVRRAFAAVAGTASTSVIAGLATAPFAAFHFNRLSAYGVAANVLVMPLVSLVIMPAGVIALVLMPFGLEWLPLQFMDWGLRMMLDTAHWVSSWPMAAVGVPSFPVEVLLLIALGLLWIACWQAAWRWLGVVPVIAGLLLASGTPRPDILIAKSGGNVAVRDADGTLSFASARKSRFDAEMWLRADGDTRDVSDALARKSSSFDCSSGACLSRLNGQGVWVALLGIGKGSQSACINGEIVVSIDTSALGCEEAKLKFTGPSLQQTGAVSVYAVAEGLRVESVAEIRGKRPWVAAIEQQPHDGTDQ